MTRYVGKKEKEGRKNCVGRTFTIYEDQGIGPARLWGEDSVPGKHGAVVPGIGTQSPGVQI